MNLFLTPSQCPRPGKDMKQMIVSAADLPKSLLATLSLRWNRAGVPSLCQAFLPSRHPQKIRSTPTLWGTQQPNRQLSPTERFWIRNFKLKRAVPRRPWTQTTLRPSTGRWRGGRPATVVVDRRNTFHLHLLLLGTDPGPVVAWSRRAATIQMQNYILCQISSRTCLSAVANAAL